MTTPIPTAIDTTASWLVQHRHGTRGLALLRIGLGIAILSFYLSDYGGRHELFGPDGVYPRDVLAESVAGSSFNLFLLVSGAAGFDLLFHVGLGLAALMTLGIGGRLVLVANWAWVWSLYQTNPMLLDGGDNLTMIALVFLVPTNPFLHYTVRVPWVRRRMWPMADRFEPLRNALHNVGLVTLRGQLLLVYLMSGLYKVQGELWQDGTALYYILRTPEFYLPGVSDMLFRLGDLLVVGAYGVTMLLVFFPVLVAMPRVRPWAVAAMALFHLSTAVLMGLTSFAVVMICFDLLFVEPHLKRLDSRSAQLPHDPAAVGP